MAEIKGKFITLTGVLMSAKPEVLSKSNEQLQNDIGLNHLELDPEDFYDTKYWQLFISNYSNTFADPKKAIIDLGKRVYPTIKRTVGLPDHLKTALDYVKYEAEGFLANHSGDDIIPRNIIEESDNHIIMYAPAPGYDETLYIGVWLGILEMCDIFSGKVEKTGESTYKISW